MIQSARFEGTAHADDLRLDRYRAFNGPATRVAATGAAFAMAAARWRLDRTVIHQRRGHDVRHARGPDEIADGLDHILLHLVLAGEYRADTGDGLRPVAAGSALLVDMARPVATEALHAHVLTVSVVREALSPVLGQSFDVHGRGLAGPTLQPLIDYLASFCANADRLPASIAGALAQALLPLLSAAFEPLLAGTREAAPIELNGFERARRIIEARLDDPRLDAAEIAARCGLSRPSLYRLFKDHGGLMAYVRNRRLDRSRGLLADPLRERSLAEIALASGFASESHLSRLFFDAYGIRPGAYRGAADRGDTGREGSQARVDLHLDHWLSELR